MSKTDWLTDSHVLHLEVYDLTFFFLKKEMKITTIHTIESESQYKSIQGPIIFMQSNLEQKQPWYIIGRILRLCNIYFSHISV